MLILAQCPTATRVAGFRQWQAKGRQVRKGEKSIKVFGYSTRKVFEEDLATRDETTLAPRAAVPGALGVRLSTRPTRSRGLLGVDISAYSVGYVAGWSKADAALIRSTIVGRLTFGANISRPAPPPTGSRILVRTHEEDAQGKSGRLGPVIRDTDGGVCS